MRVLMLHPEDSPRAGPWARQSWDLIVDLGKSSKYSERAWSEQFRCPVLRADSFRQGIADVKRVREIFSAGRGRLLDEERIDWWDLCSLLVAPEALALLGLERMAAEIRPSAELWATRPGWPAGAVGALTGRPVRSFGEGRLARSATRAFRYAGLVRQFSAAQIKEILLDKYDAGYQWRSRFASVRENCTDPVVLVPSAYGNVSRAAAAYAQLLPQQSFLMVATRHSAKQFVPPSNFKVRDLAAYACTGSSAEVASLEKRWFALKADLCSFGEMRVLGKSGVLDSFPGWLRHGIGARNAWLNVIEREPVCGVLCGDDSNLYTRLPVLLAARRKVPTVDFHHGAFDGRYLLKTLPCNLYVAKNEMERDYLVRVCSLPEEKIRIGALPGHAPFTSKAADAERTTAVFFSEPYESAGLRADEAYREILPPLCHVARELGVSVTIKLHPFENYSQRCRMVRALLTSEDQNLVTVRDGPLTNELLSQACFGITVESTTVMECLHSGVCCFLCGWLTLSPYGYVQQYARFGVGEILRSPEGMGEIPKRLEQFHKRSAATPDLSKPIDPALLQRWLTGDSQARPGVRSAS